jgi:hypothetical protein
MATYFKPWRRKIGVMTLMMACVFMAAWLRSYKISDRLLLPLSNGYTFKFVSSWEQFEVSISNQSTPGIVFETLPFAYRIDASTWFIRYCHWESGVTTDFIVFNYYSVTTLLIVLAAWLLLSKVRQKQKPTDVPIPEPAS